jgi:DNA end-binding protein Ku
MRGRSSWKGFLRLSLISVPLKAYSACTSNGSIHLNQLHRACHSPVKYRKVCPVHGELTAEAIISGYEYSKGQYVEIDPEELSKLRTRSEKAITVDCFVLKDEINPLYYGEKTYYLLPDGPVGEKPYALLHKAMVERGVYAVGQVVLSTKERLVLLRPLGRLLAMTTLHLKHEVKDAGAFEAEIAERECSEDELALAKTLIEARRMEGFDVGRYHDAYSEKLTELIEAKVEGREIFTPPLFEEPQILNLLEALKKSVAKAQEEPAGEVVAVAAGTPPKPRRKRATSSASRRQKTKGKRKCG